MIGARACWAPRFYGRGAAEWIAQNADEFAEIVRALATDLDKLALLRKSLPGEFRKSRMCDAKKFVLSFEVLLADLTNDRAPRWARAGQGGIGLSVNRFMTDPGIDLAGIEQRTAHIFRHGLVALEGEEIEFRSRPYCSFSLTSSVAFLGLGGGAGGFDLNATRW